MPGEMINVEDARTTILGSAAALDVIEVPLEEALGRVVARDLASDIDIAPFDNTAMDGFACRALDLADATGESPVSLEVVAHVGAGSVFDGIVQPGQAARIMTGVAVPQGCDCVEKIENTTFTGDGSVGEHVFIAKPLKQGANVRKAGEEIRSGQVALHAGEMVTAPGMGFLASTGHTVVPVYRAPRVGILALGSELVDARTMPGPGQIRESNSITLSGLVAGAGCMPVRYPAIPDDEGKIRAMLAKAIGECDFVISSGGASAGDYDYITQVAASLGTVHFKYVNMRPGKSQTFAVISGIPFMGLAGNPAAATCGFMMLVRPALMKMQGHAQVDLPMQRAALATDTKKKDPRRNYLRGHVERDAGGSLLAVPEKDQSSALISTFHRSNCLIVIPEGPQDLPAGTPVDCVRIDLAEGTVL